MAQPQLVKLNKQGFTLIEAVIATLLLSVIMLWSVQGMLGTYNYTSRNELRDEGIRLAGEVLTDARNTPYASLTAGTKKSTIQRQIRSFDVTYNIETIVATAMANIAYSVTTKVDWDYGGKNYEYEVTTLVGDK